MTPSNPHLVGQIALQEGLLDPDRLEECLKIQESTSPPRPLGAILLEKGYLTEEQLASLVKIQRTRFESLFADPGHGGLFGQIALRRGYVTKHQLNECLREQQAVSPGGSSLQLGQLLIRKGYVSSDRVLEILRSQSKETVGCPACDAFYDVSGRPAGIKFTCSACGTIVQVPLRKALDA